MCRFAWSSPSRSFPSRDRTSLTARSPSIPEFETGARYEAADGQTPGWSAAYDIRSVALFSDNKYTRLRANRSPREGALVARLGVLDRRTAEKLGETSPPPAASEAPKFVLTAASEERPDESELRLFEGQEGWRRSHYHRVYDSLIIGYGKEAKSNVAPKFVVIHGASCRTLVLSPLWYTFWKRAAFQESLVDPPSPLCSQNSTPKPTPRRPPTPRLRRARPRFAGGSCTRPRLTRRRRMRERDSRAEEGRAEGA